MSYINYFQPKISNILFKTTDPLASFLSNILETEKKAGILSLDLLDLLKLFDENYSYIQSKMGFKYSNSLTTLKEMRNIRNTWAHINSNNPPSIETIVSDLDCLKIFAKLIDGKSELIDEINEIWIKAVKIAIEPEKQNSGKPTFIPELDKKINIHDTINPIPKKWFIKGNIYRRKTDIHQIYGGNPNSGISSCAKFPYIFLFSSPEGKNFDYVDGWIIRNKTFQYSGGGQDKDMEFSHGNKAVRDHKKNKKELHLFEKVNSGYYKYIGEFQLQKYQWVNKDRKFIQFILDYEDE